MYYFTVHTIDAGIVPVTGTCAAAAMPTTHVFTGDRNLQPMSELQENPRRVSFQDALSYRKESNTNDNSEQTLDIVTDESVSEESGTDLADSACLIQPLPFHLPHTLEGTKVKEELLSFDVKATGRDALDPFGNLFPMEYLQDDLLACGHHKRSVQTKDDLSHRSKRFKSIHDPRDQQLNIDEILAMEQNMLAAKASESLRNSWQVVAKAVTPEKTKPDTLKSLDFSKMYSQCVSFRETHGHCAIPLKLPENPDLANWARHIRMAYSRTARGIVASTTHLSEEQKLELNKMGFCWNLKEHHWNATFENLRDQLQKFGVAGDRQTRWLKAQKKRLDKNKLTSDQARKILSLQSGPFMDFSITPLESTWV